MSSRPFIFSPPGPPERSSRRSYRKWAIAGVIVAVLALVFGSCAVYRGSAHDVTFTVTRLDDQATRDGHKYLVFTDQGVFEDTDSWMFFKFNSSDVFAMLFEGHTYTCKVAGWRIHVVSGYPNIISCVEVGQG